MISCGNLANAGETTGKVIFTYRIKTNIIPDLSCIQLDLIFIIEESQSMVPDVYYDNITQFVLNFADKFSFYNEATTQKPGFARLGVVTFSDNAIASIPLGNYSRSGFSNEFLNLNFTNNGLNSVDL